ncbi:hypothetical protein FRC05_000797 [Tulasnella sp. 425]|nr:hypothetical protein FRC05_000797 [Tulasnella sp. 425]
MNLGEGDQLDHRTANPWLDPIPASEAVSLAEDLNTDLEEFCSGSPLLSSDPSFKRLYGLGLLPLVSGVPIQSILDTISQVSSLPHLKGVIVGTRGLGKGLDDEALESVWEAIAKAGLVIFLHPHYGVAEGREWGHYTVNPFWGVRPSPIPQDLTRPFWGMPATTLVPPLIVCNARPVVSGRLKHDVRWYLGKLWFDAVAYGPEELEFVSAVIGRAERYTDAHADLSVQTALTVDAVQSSKREGSGRMLWGTDHPFFPPLDGNEKWKSVVENLRAIDNVTSWSETDRLAVRGGNAIALFDLTS